MGQRASFTVHTSLSLLSFSGGPVAQDLWSSPGTDEKAGRFLWTRSE